MDVAKVVDAVISDLVVVSQHQPNERLPKEEQSRSTVFGVLKAMGYVVCAERGYLNPDDEDSGEEADLWFIGPANVPAWVEMKMAWDARGLNNKRKSQVESWSEDVEKLRACDTTSDRYFILVGVFGSDPCELGGDLSRGLRPHLQAFYPRKVVAKRCIQFSWPNAEGVEHLAVFIWRWPPGEAIEVAG